MTFITPQMASLLAELAIETARVIEKHVAADEKATNMLQYHFPFGVYISSGDGFVASFKEEGIELYPSKESIQKVLDQ